MSRDFSIRLSSRPMWFIRNRHLPLPLEEVERKYRQRRRPGRCGRECHRHRVIESEISTPLAPAHLGNESGRAQRPESGADLYA
jgi:hypothetical protein